MTEPVNPAPSSPVARPANYADDLVCPDCAYSLRGIASDRCPECGLDLSFIESDVSIIPWEHRRELGWFKAYWLTVLMVMFRGKRFQRALYQPVNERAAHLFRGVSIAHAMIPLCALVAVFRIATPELYKLITPYIGSWFIPLFLLYIILDMFIYCGLTSYYFGRLLPPSRRDRGVAVGNYAAAPLAWTFLACTPGLAGLICIYQSPPIGALLLALSCILTIIVLIWFAAAEPSCVYKRLFHNKRSVFAFDFKIDLPILVVLLPILVGLPFGIWMIQILIQSLL